MMDFSEYDAIGFDLDMTLCRYRTSAMIRLCYDFLASYLVEKKSYPSSILAEFTEDEKRMVCKFQIVDWSDCSVKFVDAHGMITAKLQTFRYD